MKIISMFMVAAVIASCSTKDKKTEEPVVQQKKDAPPPTKTIKPSPANCYQFVNTADTVNLTVIGLGEAVTGTLSYHLKEKDRNEGTIQGNMRGDTLVADYTFMSEGVWSTRQVAFKLINGAFVEGSGATVMQEGIPRFKNISSLKFNAGMKLTEITCE